MRIRAVKPDFWQDETLGHLPDSVRLFYVGLWCVADDAGWFEYRPGQIGATLYPYRPTRSRERSIEAWMAVLVDLGRVVRYPCGCAQIPTMPRHQAIGGKPTFTIRTRHQAHEVRTSTEGSVTLRDSHTVQGGKGRGSIGGDRGGARASEPDGSPEPITEFRSRVPRPGPRGPVS